MQKLCAFDEAPLDHIFPDNLPVALGLQDAGIAAALASSRLLKPAIERQILAAMPPPPKAVRPANARLFAALVMDSAEMLTRLCRVAAVMINHKAILATTSGAVLKEIVAWCGDQALIIGLRDARFPVFARFHILSAASREVLELYAAKVKAHLMGVLPPAYRERLKLRLPSEELSEPLAFAPNDPDEARFVRYLALAREYCNVEA